MKAFIKDTLFDCYNINRRDNCSKKKSVVNNVDSSSLRAPWQKWSKQKQTQNSSKHTEQQDVTDIQNTGILFFVCFGFFNCYCLF